jgi:hypothetical protein
VGYARTVTDREALESLSAAELHDRATRLAWRRLDVGFLWHLLSTIPEARAAVGDEDRSEIDILRPLALLNDLVDADRGELAEGLRPLYLGYLMEHEKPEDLEASDGPDLAALGGPEEEPQEKKEEEQEEDVDD